MHFDSTLAVSDFTQLSAHTLAHADLPAWKHHANLRLLPIAEGLNTCLADPLARLAQRLRLLARRHGIAVHVCC